MIEHLEIPSTIVHIDSPEGRKQIQEEAEKSEHFWTSPINIIFSDFIADKRRPSQVIDPIEEEEEDQEVQEKRRRVKKTR